MGVKLTRLGVSFSPDWAKSKLHVLLQELCHRYNDIVGGKKRKHRKVRKSYPSITRLSESATKHLAFCVDLLIQYPCVKQSHLKRLYVDAGCKPTEKHLTSPSHFHDWLALHTSGAIEHHRIEGQETCVFWFQTPQDAQQRTDLMQRITHFSSNQKSQETLRAQVIIPIINSEGMSN